MTEYRFRRISHYRYAALTEDGAEVRNTIKALDYESAHAALEQKGLFVYDLKEVDAPEDLEKRCPECNHQNNWTDMVCAHCGAAVRAPHVDPDEDVKLTELPDDLVVRENSDGSITLTKQTGWKRFAPAISILGAAGMVCSLAIVLSAIDHDARAARLAAVFFALFGAAVLAACMLWAKFDREQWHVGEGFVEQRKSFFGINRGHTFHVGIIRLEDFSLQRLHNLRVSVLDRETSRLLYAVQSASDRPGRTLAAFLAQRTGWVLDEHRTGWDGVPPGYEAFARFAKWVDRIRRGRES